MSRREIWQEIYRRFDPLAPTLERAYRADRERSPANEIATSLGMPFADPRVLLTGTVGTGKSTELIRIAEARAADDFVVVLDVHRHFADVMGDEQALERVESWEVVFLAGVALVRAVSEILPYPIPPQHLKDLANAWRKLAEATKTPMEAQVDIGTLAKGMIVLASTAAGGGAAGLGVSAGLKAFEAAAGAVRWSLSIGRGPGVPFFCELYRRRVADLNVPDLISNDLLERLAYYSGGRARDFVKSIRMVARGAWIADAEIANAAIVDKVIDEARRLLEMGLDAGHIEILEMLAADPLRRLPPDPRARGELLSYGQLLPYPNESEWYYPHPLLLMHMVRTSPTGSSS